MFRPWTFRFLAVWRFVAEATPWCLPPKQKQKGHCSAWSSGWDEGHGMAAVSRNSRAPCPGVSKKPSHGNSGWNLWHLYNFEQERKGRRKRFETEIRAGVPSFSIQKPSKLEFLPCESTVCRVAILPGSKQLNSTIFGNTKSTQRQGF